MARARGKPTAPANKHARAAADERSKVHGIPGKQGAKAARVKPSAKADGRKRPPAKADAANRKPLRRATSMDEGSSAPKPRMGDGGSASKRRVGDGATAHKPRRPAAARVPRSTKRSAMPEPERSPRAAKRRAAAARVAARIPRAPRLPHAETSPLAVSVGLLAPSGELRGLSPGSHGAPMLADGDPDASGRVMELHWGDETPSSRRSEGLVQRWVKRGDALLRHLAEHGAARHEYRADLNYGRFVWVDPDGNVSAEAQAQVLCSWSRTTSALAMAWADPLVRGAGIGRVEGMPAERDDIDEEAAWRVAMEAADRARAEYLYRVTTPHAWYFLALSNLTFDGGRPSFNPSTPVGLALRGLSDTRRAVESRAEPAQVVRDRVTGLGQALLLEAQYAYRGTDWVARLERTGRRLVHLADQLPRSSFTSLAAGRSAGEWLGREATIDLSDALALLEDEWALFA